MGEGKTQLIQDQWFLYGNNSFKNHQDDDDHHETSSSSTSSSFIGENSSSLSSSSSSTICSLDTTDDASSSSSPDPSFNGSLYDLSSLMSQLPIKRGLSKFYNGKSESFTSLSRVSSIEELAKRETPLKRKMKACKSYGAGLDAYKSYTSPKPIITKKPSTKISFSSSQSRRGSFTSRSTRPPLIPVQENNNLGC